MNTSQILMAARRPHAVRVLKVVPTLLCGGTENQFMTLGRALDPGRFELAFACLRRWGPFVKELDERHISLDEYRIATFRSLHAVMQQARLARDIVRHRIAIVHSYNFYGNVFAIPPARFAGAVVIASIRDRGLYLTRMQRRVQRVVCRLADCILVNADAVKDWLIAEGYKPEKITVIRNGVELGRFRRAAEPGQLQRELGLPSDVRLVAVVSRLKRLKGIEDFLEAAATISGRFPDVRFLIVGETNPKERAYLAQLSSLAQRLGIADRVIFTGLRSDVPTLLSGVAVSVMPSLNEALSNVLLESMAAGAPVVATHVGGTPEAMTDEVTGLLVPPADPAALTAAMSRLLEDHELAARLGSAARQVIAERFSVGRMVEQTEQLYLELLARKHRKPVLEPASPGRAYHAPPNAI